ncbi:MAG: hypothetical protein JWN57_2490 [Frankiales bacterium]|jgi:hypothetical protein|nr:hypothetical protein [Frankiales bacterium]
MVLVALILALGLVTLAVRVRPEGDVLPEDASPAQRAWLRVRTWRATRGAKPLLPEGHRPPVGLGPLSPSERFLREESSRGLRALQIWLVDQTA